MASKTIRIWEGADQSNTKNMWASQSISNINSILTGSSGIPAGAVISSAKLKVYADFDGAGGVANVYMKYGFGSTSSISTQLGGEHKITKNLTAYPSSGIEVSGYMSGRTFSTSYGSYLVANIYTANIVVGSSGAMHIDYAELIVEYTIPTYTVTWKNHDGTVLETDTGVAYGTTPTYNGSTPKKTGYTFSGWSPAVGAISGNTTYTAQFTENKYTIAFNGNGNTGGSMSSITNVGYDDSKTLTANAFTRTGYTFNGWNTKADGSGTSYADKASVSKLTATNGATVTLYAVWKIKTFTVTWKNYDGTTLETDTNVAYGTTPTYNGSTPTQASTAQHTYTFSGWSPAISAVTGNVTYTAQFTATVRKYTVKWYNYDGTLLETDTDVPYGTKPTYNGTTPTKPSDDYYNYGFAGWSPSITEGIQGDKNFTAQFAQTDRYYTVRWVNASAAQGVEGTLLETDEVKFNTQPDYNGATPKHPKQDTDPALNYDFIGWSAKVTDPAKPDTELEKVKGDITYTAIYETTPKLYPITVILFDSHSTDIYEYGTQITIEAPNVVGYKFIKWTDGDTRQSRPVTVTGEATYQAIYERVSIPIKVNLEQVVGCYIVPATQTIVYVISGTVPTVKSNDNTVDGWSFLVLNEIPENGYQLEKLFITDNSGATARAY